MPTSSAWSHAVFRSKKDLGLGIVLNQDTGLNFTWIFFGKKVFIYLFIPSETSW